MEEVRDLLNTNNATTSIGLKTLSNKKPKQQSAGTRYAPFVSLTLAQLNELLHAVRITKQKQELTTAAALAYKMAPHQPRFCPPSASRIVYEFEIHGISS